VRNRLDFIPPGNTAGDVADVRGLAGVPPHIVVRDGPGGAPIEETVPGIDTRLRLWGHPFLYGVRAVQGADGPQVVELHIDSPEHNVPLSPDDLRALAKLIDRIAFAATDFRDPSTSAFHTPEKPPPKRPGRYGHGDAFYAEVALHAREAHQRRMDGSGVSVRKAIAKHWTVSVHTADKWLDRARELGFLNAGDLGGKAPATRQRRQPRRG
jgi:hypothetical protein